MIYEKDGCRTLAEAMTALEKGLEKWYARLWRDWGGWGGPGMFIWKGNRTTLVSTTRFHELEHCRQQFYLGLFFYPAYILSSLFIRLFLRKKHFYYDNPFEVAARRAAGQNRWSWTKTESLRT